MNFNERLALLRQEHEALLALKNAPTTEYNGIYRRYQNPIITAAHAPLEWRYDLNPATNPLLVERFGIHAAFNSGAILWKGRHLLCVRVEAADRKSFFAIAESPNGVDNFRFHERPLTIPEFGEPATNVYDMRLTAHEDGWIYGIFCVERKDPSAAPGDLSSAVACAGIVRTKDLENWERLPDLKSSSQQRNVVLHPEFVRTRGADGTERLQYALYTRPQDGFIDAGSGGGIGWALVDDMTNAEVHDEKIIDSRHYHTIKESKNGEGPAPIKTAHGWLHLAHGVRGCASGLRYVLYLYMTSLEDPTRVIAEPAGFFMAPEEGEYIGDVMNVLFSNGWIAEPDADGRISDDSRVLVYYASSDTRMHVAESTVGRLVDYCKHTASDGFSTADTVRRLNALIDANARQ